MKTLKGLAAVSLAGLAAAVPAYAVDTTRTYKSPILVLIFLGVCALIVVAQMVPALILMLGTISAVAKKVARRKQPAAAAVDNDSRV